MIALLATAGVQAQTILEEDFETGNTGNALQPVAKGEGWTVKNGYTGTTAKYVWHNYYEKTTDSNGNVLSTNCLAAVSAPLTANPEDGSGPREEILLTPELDLNDTYQLQFTWQVSPVNSSENSRYDLQVRVVEGDDLNGAETIFSIQNEKMLRESGVSVFPITTWDWFTSRIDLSDFKGSKVKLAFVYKMFNTSANMASIDDVTVKKFTPASGPVAKLSLDRYNFGQVYVGEKMYSDVFTLTNEGKDGLKITSVDLPQGVGLSIDPSSVSLDRYQSVDFHLYYKAEMTTPASGKAVLHTTGGDVAINFSAEKTLVPEGAVYEGFESYFPPAGWAANGWTWRNGGFEGDHSVLGAGDFGNTWLRSPQLDLSDGGSVTFTYYNAYDGDLAPFYDIELQVSYDGGDNWSTKWKTSDSQINQLLTQTVDLGTGTDESYIRWYYPAVESDDEGAFDHSTFTLDRVVLPHVYGMDGVPGKVTMLSPKNLETDIYPKDVVLSWAPAQFAKGYKLYVGTTAAANELVDGIDVGNVLTYTLPVCGYETEYRWKVVGYNDKGECPNPSTWRFTTQEDASVASYPYEETFADGKIPTGWVCTPSTDYYARNWYVNTMFPYVVDGKEYNPLASFWLDKGQQNAITTPDFQLPADKPMTISFAWGDGHPSDLKTDPAGLAKKNNATPDNGRSMAVFEILADGVWTELSRLSEERTDEYVPYWITEQFDLSVYAGKTVAFRWRHISLSGNDPQQSIACVKVEEAAGSKASFNKTTWSAGKVNYGKAIDSGEIYTLFNQGFDALKVKSVSFDNPNFSTSISAGDEIPAGGYKQFSIRFDALTTPGDFDDALTINFESGYSIELPVSATALADDTYYYSFEPNALDYDWETDFSMIDVDNGPGYTFTSYCIYYSKDGPRCAFSVESDSKEHGLYGMMAPISGMHALVASSPQNSNADNWIISKKMKATAASKFEFYARNWESNNTVLPAPKHNVTVLVSTKGNTKTTDFTEVLRTQEIPFLDDKEWKHYDIDLSSSAGQEIYVALRHSTISPSNLAFFDDFTFSGFDADQSGVEDVVVDFSENAAVEVFGINGMLVAEGTGTAVLNGLEKGFYIVKVTEGNAVKTFRVVR